MNDTTTMAVQKVLVVEDDSGTYVGLRRLLEHYGCAVDHAGTVADAIRRVDGGGPQYVLLDLNLPDGEGVGVLEHVRRRDLPARVIVVTGTEDRALLARTRSLKPEAVLRKPVNFMQILELMRPAA